MLFRQLRNDCLQSDSRLIIRIFFLSLLFPLISLLLPLLFFLLDFFLSQLRLSTFPLRHVLRSWFSRSSRFPWFPRLSLFSWLSRLSFLSITLSFSSAFLLLCLIIVLTFLFLRPLTLLSLVLSLFLLGGFRFLRRFTHLIYYFIDFHVERYNKNQF